jgi:hypothetical protein
MIGMKVGQKDNAKVGQFKNGYPLIKLCCCSPPYNSRAKIDQIGTTIHHNSGSRARTIGVRCGVPVPSMTTWVLFSG